MATVESVLAKAPESVRVLAIKHRELLKFALVGAICWVITTVIWYALKLTVLSTKVVTAQAIAIIIAAIVSYVLSREWSFRTRGGRERHHEAAIFFVISGVAVGLMLAPEAISRYWLHLEVPYVSVITQELSDFLFGSIVGTLIGTVFRFWAIRKFVFPEQGGRARAGNVSALRPEDSVHVTTDEHDVA